MDITLKNLGLIQEANFTVGDLTVICGRNNTGKTYITYATYGFLDYWHSGWPEVSPIPGFDMHPLETYARRLLHVACMEYSSNWISKIFVGGKNKFKNSTFYLDDDIYETPTVKSKNVKTLPKVFIASAERTGAALFQREVDFTRSRLIDILKETNVNPQQLLGHFTAEYPLPVKHNIDFIRDLPNIVNKQSIFTQEHPEVLQAFDDIAGGEYAINTAGGISYSPSNQPELNLSLAESSSTVRSLVEIGFYLRHLAQKGDLLMVDEPELNLHPENQRKIARLFAMLVNHGIRVFITTHSDYIIKEFNTLLLLNKSDERLQALAQREGYQPTELLKPEQLNVYMTTVDERVTDKISYTLIPAKITSDSGIELTSFNDTIEDMNRLQDEIVWG
ncbi:MAG: ATP-binding protein [Candidatus Thiothrix putei]|uniref:ATP-binding protein n=1 Tax=Candidatus Thiothrix putei TaxID=3080811 RepID=A0AA95KJY0_9GAMM|nr:MAG: ATP-binding protein [Candidatus Thiothrix putei]